MAIRSLKSGSFSRSTQVGNSIILPGDYESIATVSVGAGGSSYVEFTSIPNTYKHLQLRANVKFGAAAVDFSNMSISINSGTGATNSHVLRGNGTAASSYNGGANYFQILIPSGVANTFGVGIVDFLDYSNTTTYKTIRGLGGYDTNGAGWINFASSFFSTTSAISSIKIYPDYSNWAQYSHFALYGIRG